MSLNKQKVDLFFENMQSLNDLYPPEMRFSLDQHLTADREFYQTETAKKLIKILQKRGLYIESPADISSIVLYLSGHPMVAASLDEGYNGLSSICILLLLQEGEDDELKEVLGELIELTEKREEVIKRIETGMNRYMNRLLNEHPELFDIEYDEDDEEDDDDYEET